jgi:hypothetical protein
MPNIVPRGDDPKPLATARRKYYGAWTGFWISLPVAFMLSGITATYKSAYDFAGDADVGATYNTLNAVSTGAWIGFGGVAVYSIYRIIRYGHTAAKDVPGTVKYANK